MNITTRAANVTLRLLATAVVLGLKKTNAEGLPHFMENDMRSRRLEVFLLLITALTKPKAWVLAAVSFYFLTVFKWISEGQAIYFDNWQIILRGLLNSKVPIEQKFFLVGFFCLLTAISLASISIVKIIAIQLSVRFGKKPEL